MDAYVHTARVYMKTGPDGDNELLLAHNEHMNSWRRENSISVPHERKVPLAWKELVNAPVSAIVMAVYNDVRAMYYEPYYMGPLHDDMREYYNKNIAETSKDVVKIQNSVPYKGKKGTADRALDEFQNAFDDDNSLSTYQKAKIARMILSMLGKIVDSDDPSGTVGFEEIGGVFLHISNGTPLYSDL
jgi:hypothetical protein